jgi:hypothetical protein
LTTGAFAGAIVEGSPTSPIPEAGNDTARNITSINEQALLLGFNARPIDALRINGDFEFGYNDQSFTRIDPRQVQSYKIHANYKPKAWANLDGAVEIHENRDNVATVDNLEHDRSYSFATILTSVLRTRKLPQTPRPHLLLSLRPHSPRVFRSYQRDRRVRLQVRHRRSERFRPIAARIISPMPR